MKASTKNKLSQYMKKNPRGVITLSIATSLLIASTLITMTSTKISGINKTIVANDYSSKQAFEAADAGIEYALGYLNKNQSLLNTSMNKSSGYLDTNSAKVTRQLTDGTAVTVIFQNPTAHDTSLITVTSSGLSKDGRIQRKVSQKLQYNLVLKPATIPPAPVVVRTQIELKGTPTVNNPENLVAVWSGGNAKLIGTPNVYNSENQDNCNDDNKTTCNHSAIHSNDSKLSSSSVSQFFRNYFGNTKENVKQDCQLYFTYKQASANLNGLEDTLIWVDGDTRISGNTNIGTSQKPVILIVDGNLKLVGNANINGFVYVVGNFEGAGTSTINGSLAVQGSANINGTANTIYNSTIVKTAGFTHGVYVRIPGTWKDS